jgi:UDP-3-O-[3-hydroxymyristoyl] N-acetylglucosamine deacetylase
VADFLPSRQKTLANAIEFSGVGLFTGELSHVRILPSPANAGIVFQRMDLPEEPLIPALLKFVSETPRCTCLAKGNASVRMVEHLLSALQGLGIDNALIEIQGPEIPASDGSALEFVRMIEQAGTKLLDQPKKIIRIEQPVFWSEGHTYLVALPCDVFRVSYTLHYPHSSVIGSQYCSLLLNPEVYRLEIAQCRTFSLYEEIAPLIAKGLLKGAGLDKGVLIQGDRILNPEGIRCEDEMVRHKILDLIGDMALLGASIQGHVIAVRSGHAANVAFSKRLYSAQTDLSHLQDHQDGLFSIDHAAVMPQQHDHRSDSSNLSHSDIFQNAPNPTVRHIEGLK